MRILTTSNQLGKGGFNTGQRASLHTIFEGLENDSVPRELLRIQGSSHLCTRKAHCSHSPPATCTSSLEGENPKMALGLVN